MLFVCVYPPRNVMYRGLIRHSGIWTLLLTALSATSSRAVDDEWKCAATLSGHNYDFTSLGGERTLSRERENPPTIMVDKITLDLCKPIVESTEGAEGDRARIPTPFLHVLCRQTTNWATAPRL